MKIKYVPTNIAQKINLDRFLSFHKNEQIKKLRKTKRFQSSLFVRSGSQYYEVDHKTYSKI